MEYEQFFTQDSCNCYPQIKIVLVGLSCVALLVDCLFSCRERGRLNAENKTLKSILSKSFEKTIMRNLKNGYETSESDEE